MAATINVNIDPGAANSIREFLGILSRPKLDKAMFQFRQSDWSGHFQSWCVVYAFASVAVSVLFLVLRLVVELAHFALVTMAADIATSVITMAIGLVFAYLGWFCIVKRKGCCGKPGYVAWVLIYSVFCIFPLLQGAAFSERLVYLIMIVPVGYMVLALVSLLRAPEQPSAPLVRIS
mmetsp:Transcript_59358/g.133738  ORF Transcript_59358/g.133738 Transcript_59358/m.133738 type:complete len:177 (-) Transcript_59358:270-800(-)